MADTKRLLLLKAICSYLKSEITLSNGYNFDLAAAYRGKKNFGREILLPAICVLENFNPDRLPEMIGGVNGAMHKYDQVYLLNGWVSAEESEDEEDAAHRLLGDVKKALGKLLVPRNRSGFFDGLANTLAIEPGVVRPPDEQSEKTYFWMRIRLEIVEKVGDPYWVRD